MKMGIWPVLILLFSLAGCAAGGYPSYQPSPYERPWYFYEQSPPLPVSPEVLGSQPGGHNPFLSFTS